MQEQMQPLHPSHELAISCKQSPLRKELLQSLVEVLDVMLTAPGVDALLLCAEAVLQADTNINIYIYIYMCVCVCVCVYIYICG